MKPCFTKGHEFHGPSGQGYRLTRDVYAYGIMMAGDFEAFGGAPKPEPGGELPEWLAGQMWPPKAATGWSIH